LVRVLSDGKISWARGPKVCVILHLPQLEQSSTCSFGKKKEKKGKKKKTRRRDTRVGRIRELLNQDIDEFRLLWELSIDATDVKRSMLQILSAEAIELVGNNKGCGVQT